MPLRSVTENVILGYEPKRFGVLIDWREAHRRARGILARFGIDIDVHAPLGSYSTAIRQLVAIARAVSLDAKLVIMDEPTSSLDASEIKVLFGVVRGLRAAGVSVLYVSHFLDEVLRDLRPRDRHARRRTVDCRAIAGTTKLELIAVMLGRDTSEIEQAGMTEFGGGSAKHGEVLLKAEAIATGLRLSRLDHEAPPRRDRRPRRPARLRADRGRPRHFRRRRADRRKDHAQGRGERARHSAPRPSPPASASSPRIARPRASCRTCRCARTSRWRSCRD